jgi:hypothetical protein
MYQSGQIALYNTSTAVVYVGGVSIASQQTASVPLGSVLTDPSFIEKRKPSLL